LNYLVIVLIVNQNSINLIIMGSRGEGHAEQVLLGSVSYHVDHKSKIPITIVK